MPSFAATTSSLPAAPPRSSSDASSPTATARSSLNLLRSLARARRTDLSHRALLLFRSLHSTSSPSSSAAPPPHFSLPAALSAAAFLAALPEGRQLHALAAKIGLAPAHAVVSNSLVHLYASCGLPDEALALFRRIPAPTLVSWNTAVDALAGNGDHLAALALFREMQRDRPDLSPDAYTVQSVLGACAGAGALSLGLYAHALLLRELGGAGDAGDVSRDVLINNSLVDLYGKCGAVELARQVFDRMPERDLASWNAMVLALANHGRVRESLDLFDRMTRTENVVPNAITFVAVLSACNHGGLVAEGRGYFAAMVSEYGIRPRIEHYGCMVDILARAGLIEEALDVVAGMKCRPDSIIWRSLLDACCKRNAGLELSEAMAKLALDVPDDAVSVSGVYVLLSRVYASAQRWNDVGMIRRLMSEDGFKKEPGFSSIEMAGSVHQFVAGDTSHPQSEEIYKKLDEIQQRLTSAGYKPDLSEAPMVADMDRTKGATLRLHSERLAISFGLFNATPGAPIRILKNLRVCKDCHTISKLISKLYDVEIIVRDRIRFHHFKDGSCSCKDYW
ncbi:hypothetical protein HU200_013619 [Digitaria exilis]|uniref:DYW domain-containing protein n=1 Tax=Digitaria exilis TaxID=1010633 RepID=A0A835FCV6_9POAL|nr:hypothetical protein HU200_046403 [Digitaria exilis]KAF8742440.1 hypothetical protein HU200_013619 [Digitaria exilis]